MNKKNHVNQKPTPKMKLDEKYMALTVTTLLGSRNHEANELFYVVVDSVEHGGLLFHGHVDR